MQSSLHAAGKQTDLTADLPAVVYRSVAGAMASIRSLSKGSESLRPDISDKWLVDACMSCPIQSTRSNLAPHNAPKLLNSACRPKQAAGVGCGGPGAEWMLQLRRSAVHLVPNLGASSDQSNLPSRPGVAHRCKCIQC